MKRLFAYFILFTLATGSFAQTGSRAATHYKLAMQHFDQNEYEKANAYFEDLFDSSPDAVFNHYYKSLLGAKDFSKAEKVTKKMQKHHRDNPAYHVLLGHVYKLQEDPKKEKEAYEKAVKELQPLQNMAQMLANSFLEFDLYDYALQVYDKAKTKDYPFFYEKAEVYRRKNDIRSMISMYLDALEFRETDISMVQTHLQNSLGYDDEAGGIRNPLLKQELQRRIQKSPDKIILVEFLIVIQKLQKDFEGAFVQVRALDRRLKEEGSRVYDLAKLCVSNQQWETARRCYEYTIEKGPGNLYYDGAMVEILNVEYLAITQRSQPKKEELLALEQKYKKAVEKYAGTTLSAMIIKNLAQLQAYYLGKTAEAIELLQGLVGTAGADGVARAEYKLMLADIYLITGEIWEASLLYSQVEKDFKYEAIGQEAKFRNAKLSFYAGDFQWAKTQADVLKGATSKLIANDALDLSLVITDAIGVDTNDLPLKLFASAELMIIQHRYQHAIARMDSINQLFSTNTLGDDIYFKKAQIYKTLGRFAEAESMYKNILEYYPNELYGDDAQFRLAQLYDRHLNDSEKARQAYQDMMTKYPGSIYVVEARKRYRELRGDHLSN